MATDGDITASARRRLMALVELGDAQAVMLLVADVGMDLDFVDPAIGLSPLQLAVDAAADAAAQTGNEPDATVVRALLAAGADPAFAGDDGRTAADIARSYGWTDAPF